MSSDRPMIIADRLSKEYVIRRRNAEATTVGEAIAHRLRHPFARAERESFMAVEEASFAIGNGEAVGIVGRNGAGKSTLLKLLTRITAPSGGEVKLFGRVGSLLEVGTGFHPELTGRENVYLNGSILGMRRREIDRLFDDIVEFSGVARFLETPVKRYSSGMYVRLAFAVAAHLQSEILLVDEVLAVGDAEFQEKSLRKMKDVTDDGRTVLFVSHHMDSVAKLCTRALYLERGKLTFDGSVDGAIDCYVQAYQSSSRDADDSDRRSGSGEYRCIEASTGQPSYACDDEKSIAFTIERRKPTPDRFFFIIVVRDAERRQIVRCDSRLQGFYVEATDRFRGEMRIRNPWLKPGEYQVDVTTCIPGHGAVDYCERATRLFVEPSLPYPETAPLDEMKEQAVLADFQFERDFSAG